MKRFSYKGFSCWYEVVRQERKSVVLSLTGDGTVFLRCPNTMMDSDISDFLKKKWQWIKKNGEILERARKRQKAVRYCEGGKALYLGNLYPVAIRKSKKNDVVWSNESIIICTRRDIHDEEYNRSVFEKWLKKRSILIFTERLHSVWGWFDYTTLPTLRVRKMKRQWGSCNGNDTILLNEKLLYTPIACIDYVLVHELCHFQHHHHRKAFWDMVSAKYPQWKRAKERLDNEYGLYV
ncbi:MAG: M48 family metallopeptidase [Candidatus Spechtbacteria bacterium SB0662_bin_43]|uniref:M48 family metallopeptidase n=1 Tax=Candidatus Spechtbacteria bacterium SB0662_bin_43 TaxID=2604897 RepID=A0A845DL16_9BACT|nr:M48 family metallopeptidase [Candidatus Spechtbacteria bacterium SB0662_bin_43]